MRILYLIGSAVYFSVLLDGFIVTRLFVCPQFLRLLAEESGTVSSESTDMENAFTNGVDAMASSMETSAADYESKKEKQREYELACREKFAAPETTNSESKPEDKISLPDKFATPETNLECRREDKFIMSDDSKQQTNSNRSTDELPLRQSICESDGKALEEVNMLSYSRKVTVLYELLSACLANTTEDSKKTIKRRKGYDARHRVALRLIATWFDIKWIKMVHLLSNSFKCLSCFVHASQVMHIFLVSTGESLFHQNLCGLCYLLDR